MVSLQEKEQITSDYLELLKKKRNLIKDLTERWNRLSYYEAKGIEEDIVKVSNEIREKVKQYRFLALVTLKENN